MKKVGRNDPCPCGSGKKYKQCCLKAESTRAAQTANDRSEAVPRAVRWLMTKYDRAVQQALDEGYFGSLTDEEYERLRVEYAQSFDVIFINAMEWLLAEGHLAVRGQMHRVSELLLGRGGPLFSADQRHWIELLTSTRMGLYEVVDLMPGEHLVLQDILFPELDAVLVHEKAGSRDAAKHDLIAARIIPIEGHHELSGAVYAIPRVRSLDFIEVLRAAVEGLASDAPEVADVLGTLIPSQWLEWFVQPLEIPQIIDYSTGAPILLITDHYRVVDWDALEHALAGEVDVEGSRASGWALSQHTDDGVQRSRLTIEPSRRPDQIKVSYRTQLLADEGKTWFEAVAGAAVVYRSREIADPKGTLSKSPALSEPDAGVMAGIPAEAMTELVQKQIRRLYADWADEPLPALDGRTPREAIQDPDGLAQVKFLLHTYEHGEAQQAKAQQRAPVSYDFLWRALGIRP